MAEETRPRLGRGLAALLGEAGDESAALARARGQKKIPVAFLRRNPHNPRRNFNDDELEELALSIREKGIIQPIVVRALAGLADTYEIIAGERRWRAAQRAELHEVPVVVVEADDKQALELAIIENVQRTDLNPLEEARGYERLQGEFGYSPLELAKVIGKSRSHVVNTLRLMNLPDKAKRLLSQGAISAGHARALLTMGDADAIAERIVAQGLSVRDVERLSQKQARGPRKSAPKDSDTRALEKNLTDALGLNVTVSHRDNAGEVKIRYKNLEQLDALCRKLKA